MAMTSSISPMTATPTAPVAPVALLAELGPLAQLRAGRLTRRLVQLVGGLVLYGVSLAMMIRSTLGVAPWDVLHVGLTRHLPLTLGTVVIIASFLVLLAWIPLGERVGVGTLANAVLVGLAADATLFLLAAPDSWAIRGSLLVAGVGLNGVATAMYIGAQFGRGPRDGLMTGLARRTGWSLRSVRTGLEFGVVGGGLALGGPIGLGTLLYAVGIGPLAQLLLPSFVVELGGPEPSRPGGE
jgi:uncharacterized membrane protein YczE